MTAFVQKRKFLDELILVERQLSGGYGDVLFFHEALFLSKNSAIGETGAFMRAGKGVSRVRFDSLLSHLLKGAYKDQTVVLLALRLLLVPSDDR